MPNPPNPQEIVSEFKKITDVSIGLSKLVFESKMIQDMTVKKHFAENMLFAGGFSSTLALVGIGFDFINMFTSKEDPVLKALLHISNQIDLLSNKMSIIEEKLDASIEMNSYNNSITSLKANLKTAKDNFRIIIEDYIENKSLESLKNLDHYKEFTKSNTITKFKSNRDLAFTLMELGSGPIEPAYRYSIGNVDFVYEKSEIFMQFYLQFSVFHILSSILKKINQLDKDGSEKSKLKEECSRICKAEEKIIKRDLKAICNNVGNQLEKCELEIDENLPKYIDHNELLKKIKSRGRNDIKLFLEELKNQFPFAEFFCAISTKETNLTQPFHKQKNTYETSNIKLGGEKCDITLRWWVGKEKVSYKNQKEVTKYLKNGETINTINAGLAFTLKIKSSEYNTEDAHIFMIREITKINDVKKFGLDNELKSNKGNRYMNFYFTDNIVTTFDFVKMSTTVRTQGTRYIRTYNLAVVVGYNNNFKYMESNKFPVPGYNGAGIMKG